MSELFDLKVEDVPETEIVPVQRAGSNTINTSWCATWR